MTDMPADQAAEAHAHRIKRCRSKECRALIVWLNTGNGKLMPVDAGSVEPGDTLFSPLRHVSHFATCPASKRFRSRS